ncbi:uncharacterized protein LOC116248716 [Nymphaea colorata]|nr:uncharacterized protein LOC116248716 [Nymphaea colorata]
MEAEMIRIRWLRCFLWHAILSTFLLTSYHYLLLSPALRSAFSLLLHLLISIPLSFLAFSSLTSPDLEPSASLAELAFGLARVVLNAVVGASPGFPTTASRRRAQAFLRRAAFVVFLGLSAGLSLVSARGGGWSWRELGFRGVLVGVVYAGVYVYRKRFVLAFPIVQRPLFFSFKMGIPAAFKHAVRLSFVAVMFSAFVVAVLPNPVERKKSLGQFIVQQINLWLGTCTLLFSWELTHHLLQVLYTRRFLFAPPQGSAAAETNPSGLLLEALEQSTPRSLLQYLAYLDMCMVCESNVDSWRRAAFFEESGETYKRVVIACLRHLEQLTSRLGEGLEGHLSGSKDLLSQQMSSPFDTPMALSADETFIDFQLCAWGARAVAELTAKSHSEDRYGVAQLTGCNAGVLTTLLSCLVAVELCLGKKTSPHAGQLMGPASIKWAAPAGGPVDVTARRQGAIGVLGKKRGAALHSKAYAMADVLRTSIYLIVSVFHAEMQQSLKSGNLEKDWISVNKPLFGTREVLVHKLSLFIDFRAS